MPAVLDYQSISKEYRGLFSKKRVRALNDFSLCVNQGEIFGFLGPNGAGKTTAIHLAMGFMRPTSGSGHMLGKSFGDAHTRRRVGFLAENVALVHRSVRDVIRFYGGLNGMRDPELGKACHSVIELLELGDVADRNAGKLSRGMQQRVGLAQAILGEPELLILDEPTSALDPLGRVAVRELLQRFRSAGRTIFLSSHLLSEIELVCDRIGIVNQGRIVRMGTTSELLESSEESEIVIRGVNSSDFAGEVQTDGAIAFNIATSKQREVIERVWSMGGEVVRVNPHRRSLEDIFLEMTGNTPSKQKAEAGK